MGCKMHIQQVIRLNIGDNYCEDYYHHLITINACFYKRNLHVLTGRCVVCAAKHKECSYHIQYPENRRVMVELHPSYL